MRPALSGDGNPKSISRLMIVHTSQDKTSFMCANLLVRQSLHVNKRVKNRNNSVGNNNGNGIHNADNGANLPDIEQ